MTIRPAAFALLALLLVVSPGCGDDPEPAPEPSDWSAPTDDGVLSEAEVLAALAAHLDDGAALDLEAWSQDVFRVGETLWPMGAESRISADARTHQTVALVVGDVAQRLGASEGARAELETNDPVSLEIHDAFVSAVAQGPARYRVWCHGAGQTLFEKLEAERRARLFGDRDK